MSKELATFTLSGQEVQVSSPNKVMFPAYAGNPELTKSGLIERYLELSEQLLAQLAGRPGTLKRFPRGIEAAGFFQKHLPKNIPEWLNSALVTFPSGRTGNEIVINTESQLVWALNLGTIDFNPWQVTTGNLDCPDQLRIDLDPTEDVTFEQVKRVAEVVKRVMADFGLEGVAKTSGSKGIHIYAAVEPEYEFVLARRAAVALCRRVVEQSDGLATVAWWKEERQGVFLDYNQNARDRTIASAWSVRPLPAATISMPVSWSDLGSIEIGDFTIWNALQTYEANGNAFAALDEAQKCSLSQLLAVADEDEHEKGLPDLAWPPHYPKQATEPPRVMPSKRRKDT